MIAKVVFNEIHEVSEGNTIREGVEIHFTVNPATGDRVMLDNVSYVISAIIHHFNANGVGVYSEAHEDFTILLDRADERPPDRA